MLAYMGMFALFCSLLSSSQWHLRVLGAISALCFMVHYVDDNVILITNTAVLVCHCWWLAKYYWLGRHYIEIRD